MYYFPGFITVLYAYWAYHLSELKDDMVPEKKVVNVVLVNIGLAELVFLLSWWFDVFTMGTFGFGQLVLFYIVQDVYFYIVHKFIFHKLLYSVHSRSHDYFKPYAAWYCHPIEHLVLNIGSIAASFWLFPTSPLVLWFIMVQQIYMSMTKHRPNSLYYMHHINGNCRFGSFYLTDEIVEYISCLIERTCKPW